MERATRVALITYGCAKNLVDSEVMAAHLRGAGLEPVADPAAADVVVLNTCGFIGPARAEAEAGIRAAVEAKRARPGTRVVVAGCFVERYGAALAARFPGVDAWTGVRDFDRIAEIVAGEPYRRRGRTYLYDDETPRAVSTPASWAYLKISEGCSHRCAFCAIPAIKGAYRSRPAASIVREAEALTAGGAREIVLVSQDSTYYGGDRGERDGLARLLGRLSGAAGGGWIRVLYGYPEEITPALLEAMTLPGVCPYFDIPFQHAAPKVVRAMGRGMSGGKALRLLERIRRRIPEAAIRTSLIVGFPGEGEAEFAALEELVREAEFDHLGIFAYSPEEGTRAFSLGDPVSPETKARRRDRLLRLQAGISARKLRSRIGRTLEVLLEGAWKKDPRILIGRTRRQAPEVDGVVFVRKPPRGPGSPLVKVEIRSSGRYDLRGVIVP